MSKRKTIHVYAFKVHTSDKSLYCESLAKKLVEKMEQWIAATKESSICMPIGDSKTEYAQLYEIFKDEELFYIGFAKVDMLDGPVKGNIKGGLSPFNLADDEGFARMSSALYDPSTNAFIVETSLSSLSAERMLNFIYDVENDSTGLNVELQPVILPDVYAKVDSGRKEIRRIELSINPQLLPDECYKGNKSLKSVVQSARKEGFDGTISLVFQARGSSGIPESLRKAFEPIWRFITSKSDEHGNTVSRCRVRLKTPHEVGVEALDLINARVRRDVEVVFGPGRMVEYNVRYSALSLAYKEWKEKYFKEVEK